MDGYHPKRRKDKYNPYSITEKDGYCYLAFCERKGEAHQMEIEKPIYDALNAFELEDLSHMNVVDRHIEQSELTEESLHRKAFCVPLSVEDRLISAEEIMRLHALINELPTVQQRRFRLYYFDELTYEQIADAEGCTKRAVKFSVDLAVEKIKKLLSG